MADWLTWNEHQHRCKGLVKGRDVQAAWHIYKARRVETGFSNESFYAQLRACVASGRPMAELHAFGRLEPTGVAAGHHRQSDFDDIDVREDRNSGHVRIEAPPQPKPPSERTAAQPSFFRRLARAVSSSAAAGREERSTVSRQEAPPQSPDDSLQLPLSHGAGSSLGNLTDGAASPPVRQTARQVRGSPLLHAQVNLTPSSGGQFSGSPTTPTLPATALPAAGPPPQTPEQRRFAFKPRDVTHQSALEHKASPTPLTPELPTAAPRDTRQDAVTFEEVHSCTINPTFEPDCRVDVLLDVASEAPGKSPPASEPDASTPALSPATQQLLRALHGAHGTSVTAGAHKAQPAARRAERPSAVLTPPSTGDPFLERGRLTGAIPGATSPLSAGLPALLQRKSTGASEGGPVQPHSPRPLARRWSQAELLSPAPSTRAAARAPLAAAAAAAHTPWTAAHRAPPVIGGSDCSSSGGELTAFVGPTDSSGTGLTGDAFHRQSHRPVGSRFEWGRRSPPNVARGARRDDSGALHASRADSEVSTVALVQSILNSGLEGMRWETCVDVRRSASDSEASDAATPAPLGDAQRRGLDASGSWGDAWGDENCAKAANRGGRLAAAGGALAAHHRRLGLGGLSSADVKSMEQPSRTACSGDSAFVQLSECSLGGDMAASSGVAQSLEETRDSIDAPTRRAPTRPVAAAAACAVALDPPRALERGAASPQLHAYWGPAAADEVESSDFPRGRSPAHRERRASHAAGYSSCGGGSVGSAAPRQDRRLGRCASGSSRAPSPSGGHTAAKHAASSDLTRVWRPSGMGKRTAGAHVAPSNRPVMDLSDPFAPFAGLLPAHARAPGPKRHGPARPSESLPESGASRSSSRTQHRFQEAEEPSGYARKFAELTTNKAASPLKTRVFVRQGSLLDLEHAGGGPLSVPSPQRDASAVGSKQAAAPQTRRVVAELPDYGAKLRRRARELVPHNHDRLFASTFSRWMEVRFDTLQDVKASLPAEPGIYEWGCLPPGARVEPHGILAFYLGKAGTNKFNGRQNLRTRFVSGYIQARSGFIGPSRDGRELAKRKLFEDLQLRNFRLFIRYSVCRSPSEPSAVEEMLLRRIDYAGNERMNGGYRQIMIGHRRLADFPVHSSSHAQLCHF